MVPPPKIYVFYLFSAISTHEHLALTILPLAIVSSWRHKPLLPPRCLGSSPHHRTDRPYWNPMRPNISIRSRGGPYWHIEPRWVSIWRIQDPRLHGTLGEESWIMDLGSAILKFNMVSIFQYGPPWIQDSFQESRAILDLGSWIRHIEIQCVSICQCGPVLFLVLLSPRLLLPSACAYLRHPQKNKQTNGHPAARTWKDWFLFCLGGTVEHLSKQRWVVLRQYSFSGSFLAKVLLSCPKKLIFLKAWGAKFQDWTKKLLFSCFFGTVQHFGN